MTRRQHRPGIESLEPKTLLSGTALGAIGDQVASDIPSAVAARGSRLEVSIKTNRVAYNPGETVKMTFTEKNATHHAVTVAIGPSIDGFVITHDTKTVWRSNAGFQSYIITRKLLAAGAAIRLTATWTAGSVAGRYAVHNELAPDASVAFRIVRGSHKAH